MDFRKYHGLGNDYIVIAPRDATFELPVDHIRLICHRNYGVGSDGILLGPFEASGADFGLRIFNPDGSEAEKSGNGLRIFSRYLYDLQLVGSEPFSILTAGGLVQAQVLDGGKRVTVDMGRVTFDSRRIPVQGPPREVINEKLLVGGREVTFCAATIGNPHCVVLDADVTRETACTLGPLIEGEARFPNRTNVQFLEILDRERIRIEIWERGAGYTLASGSSSCAAAAVARRLGLCGKRVAVHMPGGVIDVLIGKDFSIRMTGPVVHVCQGSISEEIFG